MVSLMERLICTIMWQCLQPLVAHQRLMWRFTDDNDFDLHSNVNLEKVEVVAHILAIMGWSDVEVHGRGGPLPFNHARLSDLVRFSFLSIVIKGFTSF